ncbi:MAG: hypothetical protein KME29_31300 [Calothrix sp. FI2-JRJ7]|jgi:hypothetical protein|nr:hypothetical protein [Calothrix sp. FI2-JRJ7]
MITKDVVLPFDIQSFNPYTTQLELAQVLEIDKSTIFRHLRLAKLLLPDFNFQERLPLNRYQVWCLIRIHEAFKVFRNKSFIVKQIRENQHQFSKYTFTKQTGIKL